MLPKRYTRADLEKEVKRLYKNVSRRIEKVRALENAPTYAVKDFDEATKNYTGRTSKMSMQELLNLERDLEYIDNLKTSSVKGALKAKETFKPIADKLEKFSKDTQYQFWALYGKFMETLNIMDKYKYDVMDIVMDYTTAGVSVDEAMKEMQKKFDNLKGLGNRKLSYDFYLPSYNLLIEFQGEQHERPVIFRGVSKEKAQENFLKQQEHDKRKREYAKTHDINLLEIWYYQVNLINEILENKLGLEIYKAV